MKTTIDLSDAVLADAKRLAVERRLTLREVVEAALRRHLAEERRAAAGFRLQDRSFRGKGLQAGIAEGDWETIRSLAYEGRGG
jgi:hypothetical protein